MWARSRPAGSRATGSCGRSTPTSTLRYSRTAAGGALLTGVGGDEALAARAGRALRRRVRCGARRGHGTFLASRSCASPCGCGGPSSPAAPGSLPLAPPPRRPRAHAGMGRGPATQPARARHRAFAPHLEPAPRDGPRELRSARGRAGAAVAHLLLDPRFLAALAARRPFWLGGSHHAMGPSSTAPCPLPSSRRATRLAWTGAFWGPRAASFARTWDGEAADPEVVDPRAITREWSKQEPDAHTFLLIQSAWLERSKDAGLDLWPVHETGVAYPKGDVTPRSWRRPRDNRQQPRSGAFI